VASPGVWHKLVVERGAFWIAALAAATLVGGCGKSAGESGPTSSGDGGAISGTTSMTSASGGNGGSGSGAGRDSCALPPSILEGFVAKRTLYVAPTGDDTKDGLSAASAWATLAHSAALQPGDEVRVAAGTYPCPLLGPIAGTAKNPIHFFASGGPKSAILDCGGSGSILMQNLQYVAFDGFEIRNGMSGHCINLFSGGGPPYSNLSEHVLFIHDYVHGCGLSAIKSSQSFEIEVRDSEIASNVMAGNPLIDFAGDHDMRVIGCDIHDSVSIGVQFKGGAYNCLAEGNRIHDVADSAVQLGEATGLPYYLPGYTDWEAQDSIAANNLLFGNMRAGIAVQGCKGCIVAHNTMWATAPSFFVRGLSTTNGTGAAISNVGLVLIDNIFAGTTVPIPLNIVPPNDMGLQQGHNLYFSTGGMIAGQYSDTPIGGMGNLIDVDPRFVDKVTPDLHLAPGSPAIGKATPVKEVTRDFSGACRTDGDLGAW
jgi:hypothetical protein